MANVSFDPTAINDTSELERVQAAKPDVVVVAAFGSAAGYIAQDMKQIGYTPPTLGDDFVAASNLPALVPASDLKNWDLIYNSAFCSAAEWSESSAVQVLQGPHQSLRELEGVHQYVHD